MNQEASNQALSWILSKCWTNAAYRTQLPVIPQRPVELSDVDLEQVAGGATYSLTFRNESKVSKSFAFLQPPLHGSSSWNSAWVAHKPVSSPTSGWSVDYA